MVRGQILQRLFPLYVNEHGEWKEKGQGKGLMQEDGDQSSLYLFLSPVNISAVRQHEQKKKACGQARDVCINVLFTLGSGEIKARIDAAVRVHVSDHRYISIVFTSPPSSALIRDNKM